MQSASNNGVEQPDEVMATVIGRIAAECKVLLGEKDEALVIPKLVEIGIEEAMKTVTEDWEARKKEMRDFAVELRAEFVKSLNAESAAIGDKIRQAVEVDLHKATASAAALVQDVNEAHSRPARIRWVVVGMGVALVLIALGFTHGKYLV